MYSPVVNPIVFILFVLYNLILAAQPLMGENHSTPNSSNAILLEHAKNVSKISLDSSL
jgi:hypothetical protein